MIDIYYVKNFVTFMIMTKRSELALTGETLAAAYLEKNNCSVVARNYRCRYGEIDVIALDGMELIFAEVKTRSSGSLRTAEESVTALKQTKLTKSAHMFLQENGLYNQLSCRFDVIAVMYDPQSDTYSIHQIRNAFLPADISNDSG
jgi:putative endonuclease